MFRKVFVSVLCVGLVLCLLVVPVVAVESVFYTNPVINFDAWQDVYTSANVTIWGKTLAGNDQFLSSIRVYLSGDSASESGTLKGALWDGSFSGVTPYLPDSERAPAFYSDDSFDCSGLENGVGEWVEFSFNETYFLDSGTSYGFGVVITSALGSNIHIASDGDAQTSWRSINSAWDWDGSTGKIGEIYTESEYGGAAGGGDDVWSGGTVEVLIGNLVNWFVALALLLIPAFILGVWLKGGKWGFLIGMAVGSGLGYMLVPTLVPLWLVFLVMIGLVGLAYQSISQGG